MDLEIETQILKRIVASSVMTLQVLRSVHAVYALSQATSIHFFFFVVETVIVIGTLKNVLLFSYLRHLRFPLFSLMVMGF